MGVFGLDYFGVGKFGNLAGTTFTAAGFTATPVNYGTLVLNWQPVSNPAPGQLGNWSSITLLRSSYGHPTTIYDGVVLYTSTAAAATTTYVDSVGLKQGHFYYYTLFVYDTVGTRWAVAGRATGLVTQAFAYGDYMFSRVPFWAQEADTGFLTTAQPTFGPLQRFLRLFGSQLDRIRTETETIKNTYNLDLVSGGLLPLLAYSLNVSIEPEIGVKQLRILTRNAVHLARYKGTTTGINGISSAYTGYGAVMVPGVNIMLDLNESSFEQSIGTWTAINATLASVATGTGVLPFSTASMTQSAGMLRVTSTANANVTLDHAQAAGPSAKVPVTPGRTYVGSAYLQIPTAGTGRGFTTQINWYDKAGVAIANTGPGGNLLTPNQASLETDTTGWAAGGNTTIARSTAQALDGVASLALTAVAVGDSVAVTPQGVSGVPVPASTTMTMLASFRAGSIGCNCQIAILWYQANGAGSAVRGSDSSAYFLDGTTGWTQAQLTVVSPSDAAFAQLEIVVHANTVAGEVHYVDEISLAQGSSLIWSSGYSGRATDIAATWTRASVTGIAPSTAVFATITIVIFATTIGEIHFVDCVQLEAGSNLLTNAAASFEDGSLGGYTPINATLVNNTAQPAADGTHSLQVTSLAAGTAGITSAAGTAGMLVSGGGFYTAVGYIYKPNDGISRAIQIITTWYDTNGVSIPSPATGNFTFQPPSAGWFKVAIQATAPGSAVYASVTLQVLSTLINEVRYYDALSLTRTSTNIAWTGVAAVTPYQPARDARIYLTALRTNLIPNASFEVNTSQWTPISCTLTRVTTVTPPASSVGTAVGQVVRSAVPGYIQSDPFQIVPGTVYTASAYVQPALTTATRVIQAQIYWTDINGNVLGSVVNTNTTFTEAPTGWTQVYSTGTAPLNAYYIILALNINGGASGDTHYIDAVLVEATGFVNPYFDGYNLPNVNYSWAGAAGNSTSFYYPRRDIAGGRLQNILPGWLPLSETYTLIYSTALP